MKQVLEKFYKFIGKEKRSETAQEDAGTIAVKKERNMTFTIGCVITGVILVLTLIGFFYTPYDPEKMDASRKLAGISW